MNVTDKQTKMKNNGCQAELIVHSMGHNVHTAVFLYVCCDCSQLLTIDNAYMPLES